MKKVLTTLLVVACACYQGFSQEKTKTFIQLEPSQGRMLKTELLRSQLRMNPYEEMRALKTEDDQLGYRHEKFEHFYKGFKVEGSTYTIHSKNGVATHMTGNYATVAEVDVNPGLSSNKALDFAKSATNATQFAWEGNASGREGETFEKPEGELVIVQKTANGYKSRLAYKFHILGDKPFVNAYVYVDAQTGEIARYNSVIKHADAVGSAATRYSGTQSIHTDSNSGSYRLRDYSRGNGILTYDGTTATNANQITGAPNGASEYTDNNNNWTAGEYNNADKDNAALDAHFAAEATYDFFMSNYGRNSYDGNGAAITSYVNTDIESVYGYPAGYNDNAFWTGYVMVYGKGNSLDPLTTVDITAHEIGHAFCTGTADLVYEKESGAMNEGLSDIWGACVEYYVNQTYGLNKDLWNLGTEIGQTFRSMSNPKAYGDPDTYGGTNWINPNCNPSSQNDYCGVHTNSGVTNHWFYVLAAGETSTNDNNDSYSVTGIGVDDAAAITWRTESVYLNTTSDYADFRTYSIQSAVELFGSGSAQEIAVTNSWYAVGVGAEYVQTCSLAAPGNFSSSSINDNGFTLTWNSVSGAASYTVTVGSSSTNVSGTSYVATGLNVGTQYACSVVANCSTGGNGAAANLNVSTTGTPPLNYCSSNGNNTSDEFIGRVQFNSIDNSTSASSGGYGDYTTQSTTLSKGSAYTMTITPTWTGTVYNEGYSVWIDYNQDGDFTDSGEQVLTQSATTATPISGSINISSGAANGNTRMRVSMKYNGVPTSCESFSYGEVEDYTLNIVAGSGDTQAPTAPGNLTASNVTTSSFDMSWSASTDNVGVTGYNVYVDGFLDGSTSNTSYSVTGVGANTTYTVSVSAVDAASNESPASAIDVTTNSNGGGSTTLLSHFFESGWDGWSDGGSDCYRYNGSRSWEGNWSIRIRDNSGTVSAMTSPSYNVSGYSQLDIEFYFYAYGMETGEDFWVRYYDGSSWQTVAAYASGTNFNNNTFYSATVTLTSANYTFPTNAQFRFQCDASANADHIYIDAVTVTASSGGSSFSAFAAGNPVKVGGGFAGVDGNVGSELPGLNEDVMIFPNPATHSITLNSWDPIQSLTIYGINGNVVRQIELDENQKTIDISALDRGMYFMQIQTEEETTVEKFIKK